MRNDRFFHGFTKVREPCRCSKCDRDIEGELVLRVPGDDELKTNPYVICLECL